MYSYLFYFWSIAAFAVFTVLSVIHLVKCYQEKDGLADITKFTLMPALLLFFLAFTFLNLNSISIIHILIITALIFSFLGDWALIFDSEKSIFVLGMLFFAVTQLCYIAFSIIKFSSATFPVIIGIVTALVYICGLIYQFMRMKKYLKGMKNIVIGYGILISIMSWFFLVSAIAAPSAATILAAIGSILFIISDSMVAYSYFMGGIIKGRFFIMITYILAQFLIILGVIGMLSLS